MRIKIATAECFTQGNIGREIHAFSRGYPTSYAWTLDPQTTGLSLVTGLFIPTLTGVRSILKIEPLAPVETISDIKVYDQEGDEVMAVRMAEAVKKITGCDIGIGTTAGIGNGGIALVSDEIQLLTTSGIYADLRSPDPAQILMRKEAGITKALRLLERQLEGEFSFVGTDRGIIKVR
jgi:Uncharacterized protein conserved in archaea